MADNRGNSSSTNTNMPSGVTRGDYIDPNTLKAINASNIKYEKLIKEAFGTIKGFEDSIKKATDLEMKRAKNEKENTDKWNEALNKVADKFGKNSQEFGLMLEESRKETKKMKEDYEKSLKDWKKNVIKQSFKNESESKQIKYLDNKFAKNNNLASVSNSYWADLEKLKVSALETFGEGFEKDKGYKQALMNLNDKYTKDMRDAWKEDFKENHKVLGSVADGIKDTFDRNKEVLQGILGPLNLIIAPMKEFFGGFGLIFKGIKGGVKWLFGKFTKKNPTANDVLKSGAMGVGALWIGNKLDKMFGTTNGDIGFGGIKEKFKDFFDGASLFKKVIGSPAFQSLASVGGIALLVKDAIEGWKKGDEWGVPNWEAMVGAIIGGTDKGASGAVKGAIKYGLLGATFGPFGILAGALLGGVLGFFGGEFWAQGLDDFKNLITGKTSMTEIRKRELLKDVDKNKNMSEIQKSVMYKLADTLSEEDFVNLGNNLSNKNWGGSLRGTIDNWLKGNFDTLNEDELVSLLQYQTGFSGISKENINQYKEFFKQLHGSFNDVGLSNIYKNNETLAWNMKNLREISKLYGLYKDTGVDINSELEALGFYGGVNSKQFKQLVKSGLLDSNYGFFFAQELQSDFNKFKNKNKTNEFLSDLNYSSVDDAIIKTDGSIIKTNPKDTIVALKNIPLSMNQVREETNKNLSGSLSQMEKDGSLEKKLTTIINVLSKILAKDLQVQLPPQTRSDLDLLMNGGLV